MKHLYIISSGNDVTGKAGYAFAQAAYFASMGTEVTIFLVLEGAKWAFSEYGRDYQYPCFKDIKKSIKDCIDLGVKINVCNVCFLEHKKLDIGRIVEGIDQSRLSNLSNIIDETCHCFCF